MLNRYDRIIREEEARDLCGLSRSTRWRLERVGMFPKRRKLGKSSIGWLLSEVQAWIAERTQSGSEIKNGK